MSLDKDNMQGQGMTSLRTRQRLIERLTEKGISDVRVLEAMRDSPRHLFLDEALSSRAYEDLALPIAETVTSNACPGLENAGKSAVTITAAAFFAVKSLVLTTISNCEIND